MLKNVICHVYPRAETNAWQRCCRHLLARRALFTGKRVVAVVTDEFTAPAAAVQAQLRDFGAEFVVRRNDPQMRDASAWLDMWERVPQDDSLTYCCHAKGATKGIEVVGWWVDLAHHVLLDYPALHDEALRRRPVAGAFRRDGFIRDYPWPCDWHFSGSFYWVRTKDAPRRVDPHGWGTEAWPGRNFKKEESCCLFSDDTASSYDQTYWRHGITPAFQYWRAALRFAGLSTTDCSTTDFSRLPTTTFPPLIGPAGYATTLPESLSRPRIGDFLTHVCGCSPR